MAELVASIDLVEPILGGRVSAIARLMSRAEAGGEECQAALGEIYRHTGKAHIVGITGVPGSGKSTLVTALCRTIRAGGRRVGVVAVDPSSPFSGGSILGDRIRMNELAPDPGVFIRSMATRGALGGLSQATMSAVDILDAAGYDIVLIETVGVGQDEIDVVRAAHTTVVVSAPGLGDDIQAIKAGVLEIADVHVVSKCDRSDADRTIAELKNMMTLGVQHSSANDWQVPVIGTSCLSGEGVEDLHDAIIRHLESLRASGEWETRRRRIAETRLLKSAADILRDRFAGHRDGTVATMTDRMMSGEVNPRAAAMILLDQEWSEVDS